jgi:3-deoxy-D-manno-octulosonic acid hydroxylase-like protein
MEAGGQDGQAIEHCRRLEAGEILVFQTPPFALPEEDRRALAEQGQAGSRFHKNVSYCPRRDRLRGAAGGVASAGVLREIMRRYSRAVTAFMDQALPPYAGRRKLDLASFRPVEEEGRDLSGNRRNDLLHVDAFPTRPTRGGRILRVFTNVNPSQTRVWLTGEPFHVLAPRYAEAAGLHRMAARTRRPWYPMGQAARRVLGAAGLPVPRRAAYDRVMLRFHDWLKANGRFQQETPRARREFPPGCTWLVYTDGVLHAVLSGRGALEQTYIVPREALVSPELSPIAVLERLAGVPLSR